MRQGIWSIRVTLPRVTWSEVGGDRAKHSYPTTQGHTHNPVQTEASWFRDLIRGQHLVTVYYPTPQWLHLNSEGGIAGASSEMEGHMVCVGPHAQALLAARAILDKRPAGVVLRRLVRQYFGEVPTGRDIAQVCEISPELKID